MIAFVARSHSSTRAATVAGTLVGVAVVCMYFGAGLLIADWSVSAFLAELSIETVGYLLGMITIGIAFIALPIAAFLRFDLIAPLVVLVLVSLGWLSVGAIQGMLSLQTIFGLTLYAVYLSPIALVLYGVLGGGEYLVRTWKSGL